jgi:hypothetical protein
MHSFLQVTDAALLRGSLAGHFELMPASRDGIKPLELAVSADCRSLYSAFPGATAICTIAPFAVIPKSGSLAPFCASSWIYVFEGDFPADSVLLFVYAYEPQRCYPLRFLQVAAWLPNDPVEHCDVAFSCAPKQLRAWELSLGCLAALDVSRTVADLGLGHGAQVFLQCPARRFFGDDTPASIMSYLSSEQAPATCEDYFKRLTAQVTCEVHFRGGSKRLSFPREVPMEAFVEWLLAVFGDFDSDPGCSHVYCGSQMARLQSLRDVMDNSVLHVYTFAQLSPRLVWRACRVLLTFADNGMNASPVEVVLFPEGSRVSDLVAHAAGRTLTYDVRVLKTTSSGRIQRIVGQTECLVDVRNSFRVEPNVNGNVAPAHLIPVNFALAGEKLSLAFVHPMARQEDFQDTRATIQAIIRDVLRLSSFPECHWELRRKVGTRIPLKDGMVVLDLCQTALRATLEVTAIRQ